MRNAELQPAGSVSHMTDESVRRSVRLYLFTGLLLFCGTIATYLIATVPWLDVGEHGFDKWDALLGIGIASFKASLVAAIFMHLNHERRMVYSIIGFGTIHLLGLFVGIFWYHANRYDKYFYEPPAPRQTLHSNATVSQVP